MSDTPTLSRYVIALRSRRECDRTPAELLSAIQEMPDVRIVEGAGLRAVTVDMEEATAALVEERLTYATVSKYRELKLL